MCCNSQSIATQRLNNAKGVSSYAGYKKALPVFALSSTLHCMQSNSSTKQIDLFTAAKFTITVLLHTAPKDVLICCKVCAMF